MNSRGQFEYILAVILGLVVIVIIVALFVKLDLVKKLDIILPHFNSTNNQDGVFEEIYLDKDGRCKPIEGYYSLNHGNLEVWDGKSWDDITIVSEERYLNGKIRKELVNYKEDLSLNLDRLYSIDFINNGFISNVNGETFLYSFSSEGEILQEDSLGTIFANGDYKKEDNDQEKYESILKGFREALDKDIIASNENLNVDTGSHNGEYILYVNQPEPFLSQVGINYLDAAYTRIRGNVDWEIMNEKDIADNAGIILYEIKKELIEKC